MKKTVLIFGGNGFIGSETVEYLLDNNDDLELILVNRGHWNDWDHKLRIKSRIFKNVICDRKKESLKFSLKEYLENENFKFEAVIDFSAYKNRVIKNTLNDIPSDKIKLYILISTDSVYEVSMTESKTELRETDSIRPNSIVERKNMKKKYSYGHHKLKCEELIIKYSKLKNLNYVILRLPDVVGQRDSTERFWSYQMWLQYLAYAYPNTKQNIFIPKNLDEKRTSYVYVKDVAKVINLISNSNIKNEVFNISYETGISLKNLYELIAEQIDSKLKENLQFIEIEDENSDKIFDGGFPSMVKGSLNIDKIKGFLKFKASDLNESFREIVNFYNQAYSKYPKERKSIEKDLKKNIITDKIIFEQFINSKINSNQ